MLKRQTQQAFSLIEMVFVIIVIGVLISMIARGNSTIQTARGKELIQFVQTWESLQADHLDIYGHFAGDTDLDGIIENDYTNDITVARGFHDIPNDVDLIRLGSLPYRLAMGEDDNSGSGGSIHNIILLTDEENSSSALTLQQRAFLAQLDAAIDGAEDAGSGRVRGITAGINLANHTNSGNITVETTANSWTGSTSYIGLVYYFDEPL